MIVEVTRCYQMLESNQIEVFILLKKINRSQEQEINN